MRKLIIKGKEIASVSILADSSEAEQFAAKELAKYLGHITGIRTDGGFPIRLQIDAAAGYDGLRIDVSEDALCLTGGNERGVIYAVYELLERYAGCRFFMPNLELLGDGDVVIDEDYAYAPVLEFRQSDWQCGNNLVWSVKNRINNRTIPFRTLFPKELGGCHKYANGEFAHTMKGLTGKDVPCLSDPKNLTRALAKVRETLEKDPAATILTISQNDGMDYCTCDTCRAIEKEEGSPMGAQMRFVNAIADEIGREYPDLIFDTLSYVYTRKPPKITKPRQNVCVRLCSFECCSIHPLTDPTCPENKQFCKDVEEWNQICNRIYIWDYVTNFVYSIPPFPNFDSIRENMRFFADHGLKGIYPEGNYYTPQSGEFGELRCYLLAKLMWNPYMDTTEYYRHMDEFLAAYYGDGWRCIRAFIDFTVMEARGRHFRVANRPFEIIPRESYVAMEESIDGWWDKAEALAGDRLEYVRRSRMQWRYIKLMLHPNTQDGRAFLDDVAKWNIAWSECRPAPKECNFEETPDRWVKDYPGIVD